MQKGGRKGRAKAKANNRPTAKRARQARAARAHYDMILRYIRAAACAPYAPFLRAAIIMVIML